MADFAIRPRASGRKGGHLVHSSPSPARRLTQFAAGLVTLPCVTATPSFEPADSPGSRPSTRRGPTQRRWARVAAGVSAIQGLALVGFVGFYIYEIAQGAADDLGRAVMSCVLFVVFAWGLFALARGWLRDLPWPRTPTIVWNVLLLPVAWSMSQADRVGVAVALGGGALLAIAAAAAAGSPPD